jgi:hypothetical protein
MTSKLKEDPCVRKLLSSLTIVVLVFGAIGLGAETRRATGMIELSDPAGDVDPVRTLRDGVETMKPGLDIIKLSITSDGKQISFATTLAGAPGVGSGFLQLFFDTDRSVKTGMTLLNPEIAGFDLGGELDVCADYSDRSSSCIGGPMDAKAKVEGRYAMLRLNRYKGKDRSDGVVPVVEYHAFSPATEAAKVPIAGTVVQGSLDYTSLKVKSGQTIRILARESNSGSTSQGEWKGFFPEIQLTLK